MKYVFARFYLLASILITAACLGADQKYNVLFIAVDDLRPELGCYGHPMVKSPNIDRLASQGLQFDRAYCQFALCNPSRASLLTGRRPETTKVYDLKTFVRKHDPNVVTLPQLFKNNGYRTLNFGKIFHATNGNHDDTASWSERPWHSPKDDANSKPKPKPTSKAEKVAEPDSEGDPHSNEMPYRAPEVADAELSDGQIAERAVAALKGIKDQPFFLAVGFHKPHLPFVAPRKYWDLYDPVKIKLAANPFHPKDAPSFANNDASELRRYKDVPKNGAIPEDLSRKLIHGYYASVSYTDAQIGKVLNELDRLGLRDKTIVILWGDHGYHLGEHATWNKRTDWEIATRVPMMISVPGMPGGKRTSALVEFVDIYPSLAELCKLPLPSGLEGISFTRLIKDPQRPWKKAAFSLYVKEVPELGKGDCFGRAMRTDRYRFIEWSVTENPKRVFELYDHQADPSENVNIAGKPENKELIEMLSKQLAAGWKSSLPESAGK